jgi:hypothetical protein
MNKTDKEKRYNFMVELSKKVLPIPQKEGEWHAARIYIDSINDSVYDIEQWEDYLKLKNRHPYCTKRLFEYNVISKKKKEIIYYDCY